MFFWKSLKIYTSLEADKYLIKGFCISQPPPPQCLLAPWDVVFGGTIYRFQKESIWLYLLMLPDANSAAFAGKARA